MGRIADMTRNLSGSRVLITGASSGIGRCLAEQVVREGARVMLAARSADTLRELADQLSTPGAEALAVAADITAPEDRQRLIRTVREQWGGLDVLINNAGVASFGHFAGSSEAILRQVMEVNFFAPTELMRLAIPELQRGRQPVIVNVASMCGRRGLPAWTEYSASKFALCGLTEALRAELVRFGIDVLLVLPGLTNTGLGRNMLRNEGRMKIDHSKGMAPQDVAAAIVRSVRNNRSETILGYEARWMLRINRFFPGLLNRLLIWKVGRLYAHS
jgi:short-subunit dehydrogenase